MAIPFPLLTVEQPLLGEAPVGSLLSTFPPLADPGGGDRWELGYQFATGGSCVAAYRWGPCSGVATPAGTGSTIVEAVPISVRAPFRCSTFGMVEEDYQQFARDALTWMGGAQLEAELWDGLIATQNGWPTPYLLHPAATIIDAGGAFPWPVALALLQKELRACMGDSVGVIHASPALVSLWHGAQLVSVVDGKLRDVFGNYVVAGAGYSGYARRSAVYTLTEDAGADYTLTVTSPITGDTETTAAIVQGGGPGSIQTALDNLAIVESGDLVVAGAGPFTITGAGRFANQAITITRTGTPTLVSTTAGGEVETWGEEYAFATDIIDVRMGEVTVLDPDGVAGSLDRSTNTVEFIAEATMSAAWGRCCHIGVLASLSDACSFPAAP